MIRMSVVFGDEGKYEGVDIRGLVGDYQGQYIGRRDVRDEEVEGRQSVAGNWDILSRPFSNRSVPCVSWNGAREESSGRRRGRDDGLKKR